MSDAKLLSNEERKEDQLDLPAQDMLGATSVANTGFEMTQKTLTSFTIKPKDLKAKIQEHLESTGVTRDELKLLLKQGAEDNYMFMIKEETYDKLVDTLGLKLDHDNDKNMGDITGLLATARLENYDDMSKSPNIRNLDSTANRFAMLMKSRLILRDKSVAGVANFAVPKFGASKPEMRTSINNGDDNDDEKQMLTPPPRIPVPQKNATSAPVDAQETTPDLLERVPRITNQGLKNNMIVAAITFISIVCFLIWAMVTYYSKTIVVTDIVGPGLLVSRGSALSILVLSIFLILFVSYDFLS